MTELPQAWRRLRARAPSSSSAPAASSARRICRPIAASASPSPACFDIDPAAARETAARFGVPAVFASLAEAAAAAGRGVRSGVPGDQIAGVLEQLPDGAAVLIQKPMGADLAEARRILRSAATRPVAAVNLQLRFSPACWRCAS